MLKGHQAFFLTCWGERDLFLPLMYSTFRSPNRAPGTFKTTEGSRLLAFDQLPDIWHICHINLANFFVLTGGFQSRWKWHTFLAHFVGKSSFLGPVCEFVPRISKMTAFNIQPLGLLAQTIICSSEVASAAWSLLFPSPTGMFWRVALQWRVDESSGRLTGCTWMHQSPHSETPTESQCFVQWSPATLMQQPCF